MPDGIRIQPSSDRLRAAGVTSAADRLIIVRDLSRPYGQERVCGYCTRLERQVSGWKGRDVTHGSKTYHFQLEGDGTIMVSTGVWGRLQMMFDNGGFERVNAVKKPPSQSLIIPTAKVQVTTPKL